jgi:hypothetical protein
MSTQPTARQRTRHIAALGLALLLLTATLTAVAAHAAPPAPAALDGKVDWDDDGIIISNGERAAYPWSAVDSAGVTHVIYMTFKGEIMYTNRSGPSFNKAGKRLDSGSSTPPAEPFAAIAIGVNNTIHVLFTRFNVDNQLYYRQSGDGGLNWSPRQHISSGAFKAATPHLVVDPTNNAHIVWIDDRCGPSKYNVYYRVRRADGSLSRIEAPLSKCDSLQKRPSITYADDKPHVVFTTDGNRDITYRRRDDDGGWRGQGISESGNINSQSASIASDGGTNLFVAWDENVGGHDIFFRASFDGGFSWSSNKINMSGSGELSRYPNVSWSPSAKRAIIVWEDAHGSRDKNTEIWERQFDPVSKETTFADQITHFNKRSQWPTVGSGGPKADIVWLDEAVGEFQVWSLEGDAGEVGCEGSLVLNGGAASTRDRTLSGTITSAGGCVPNQMQISLDTPVTDATPKIAYNASIPLQTVPEGGCVHTVYARLFKNGVGGNIFSDNIQVDSTVDASVRMINPHMIGLPTSGGAPGAQHGDPRYTRDQQFYLTINETGECLGLQNYTVQGGSPVAIPEAGFADTVALPGGPTPPARNVNVAVTDKINNSQNFQTSLIFDSGAPTLVTTGNPTVTTPLSTTNIIVPLSFDNITINDAVYGTQGENLDQGKRFWGVWIAVSRTTTAPPTTDLTRWAPVEVLNPDSTFTINWSLFSGLDNQSKTAGDYYVFVKFLDGAGNFTTGTIESAKITLESGFTRPTQFVPFAHR